MLRSALLTLSRQNWLRAWVENSPLTRGLTQRFVAGASLAEAIEVCEKLNQQGILVTLDHLGESVSTLDDAAAARDSYVEALAEIERRGLPSSVSVKLTQFGLDLSQQVACQNVQDLVRRAQRMGTRVEIDMEDHTYTDRTLEIVREMHSRFGCVRAVIQAYLYRSEKDIDTLSHEGIPVRLCKGAYKEPAQVAYPEKSKVDESYRKLTRKLLADGTYAAIATHDENMVRTAMDFAAEKGIAKDSFEFQMLYGIRRDLQAQIIEKGYRLRLYVPYGTAWYPYFMRRLAERPANLLFLAKNLVRQ